VINCHESAQCSILVENETHPFKGGLVYNATPPGKKFGFGTEGLSSGELSLANLCFFLAVNEALNSPFVVFDESDAHLDVDNIKKYASMIRRLIKQQQVLFISHKPAVFSQAQSLIGVTRAPQNSSLVLSLKI
jgi:chromosome segregation ATPase